MPGTHVELGKRTAHGSALICQAIAFSAERSQDCFGGYVQIKLSPPFPSPLSLYKNQFKFVKGINIKI